MEYFSFYISYDCLGIFKPRFVHGSHFLTAAWTRFSLHAPADRLGLLAHPSSYEMPLSNPQSFLLCYYARLIAGRNFSAVMVAIPFTFSFFKKRMKSLI